MRVLSPEQARARLDALFYLGGLEVVETWLDGKGAVLVYCDRCEAPMALDPSKRDSGPIQVEDAETRVCRLEVLCEKCYLPGLWDPTLRGETRTSLRPRLVEKVTPLVVVVGSDRMYVQHD